jgi:hypothetical protein
MSRLHLLPSRISKFSGPPTNQEGGRCLSRTHPHAHAYSARGCPISTYFQKILHLLKNLLRTLP